jgi:hypothetical protein
MQIRYDIHRKRFSNQQQAVSSKQQSGYFENRKTQPHTTNDPSVVPTILAHLISSRRMRP